MVEIKDSIRSGLDRGYPKAEDRVDFYSLLEVLLGLPQRGLVNGDVSKHPHYIGDGVYWLPLDADTLLIVASSVCAIEDAEKVIAFFDTHEVWFTMPYETDTFIFMAAEPKKLPRECVNGQFNYGSGSVITVTEPGQILIFAEND